MSNDLFCNDKIACDPMYLTLVADFKRIPSDVQQSLIEMVANKQRENFDNCLRRYNFSDDEAAGDVLWDEMARQIGCISPSSSCITPPSDDRNTYHCDEDKTIEMVNEFVRHLKKEEKTKLVFLVSHCDSEAFTEYLQIQFNFSLSSEEQQLVWDIIAQTIPDTTKKSHKIEKGKLSMTGCKHLELVPEEYEIPAFNPDVRNEDNQNDKKEAQSDTNVTPQQISEAKHHSGKKWFQRLVHWKKEQHAVDQKNSNRKKKMMGTLSEHLPTFAHSAAAAAGDSIAREKSETYVVGLKPPSKELMTNFADNNPTTCRWYRHHENQEKEDIFICV